MSTGEGVKRAAAAPGTDFPEEVAGGGLIYATDDGRFVIADVGGWLPGNYATRDTAARALEVPYKALHELQERINKGEHRPITMDDLTASES